jgi:hypothetical protein
MIPRSRSVIALALTLAMAGALAADAGARVVAHWKVTIAGSVRHDWTLLDSSPCQASGSGSVNARFSSVHPEHITIADTGYGPGDTSWDGVFRLHGTITAHDDRTRNPPDPGEQCSPEMVPDTRACRTAPLKDALNVQPPLGRQHGYALGNWGNFTNALTPPDGVADCEFGGFISFALFLHGGANQDLKLPHYPSDSVLASRHARITLNVSQTHHFLPNTTTVRKVTIVFTRVR